MERFGGSIHAKAVKQTKRNEIKYELQACNSFAVLIGGSGEVPEVPSKWRGI